MSDSIYNHLVKESDANLHEMNADDTKGFKVSKTKALSIGFIIGISTFMIIALTNNNYFSVKTSNRRNLLAVDTSSMCCDSGDCPKFDETQNVAKCKKMLQNMWQDICDKSDDDPEICPDDEKAALLDIQEYFPCHSELEETSKYWCLEQNKDLTPEQKMQQKKKFKQEKEDDERMWKEQQIDYDLAFNAREQKELHERTYLHEDRKYIKQQKKTDTDLEHIAEDQAALHQQKSEYDPQQYESKEEHLDTDLEHTLEKEKKLHEGESDESYQVHLDNQLEGIVNEQNQLHGREVEEEHHTETTEQEQLDEDLINIAEEQKELHQESRVESDEYAEKQEQLDVDLISIAKEQKELHQGDEHSQQSEEDLYEDETVPEKPITPQKQLPQSETKLHSVKDDLGKLVTTSQKKKTELPYEDSDDWYPGKRNKNGGIEF